jgi:hypothetical protein
MIKERTTTKPVTDEGIIKAICLKAQACYNALAICRALGGEKNFEDEEWWLCSTFCLKELVDEAKTRNLDLSQATTPVERQPVLQAMKYRHAVGEITTVELNQWWQKVKSGEIEI